MTRTALVKICSIPHEDTTIRAYWNTLRARGNETELQHGVDEDGYWLGILLPVGYSFEDVIQAHFDLCVAAREARKAPF